MDKIAFLRTTPLLAGVEEAAVVDVSQYFVEEQLRRGEEVLGKDSAAQTMYFVAEGVLKAYKISANGREQILSLMRPGDFFDEMLLDGGPSLANVAALGVASLYGIGKEHLHIIMERHHQIARNLLNMLAWRIRYLVSLVEDLSFRTVVARLAKILLDHSQTADKTRLTQRDMAALVGSVREVISRSLKYMEDRELIEIRRRQIILKNLDGLKELAELAT